MKYRYGLLSVIILAGCTTPSLSSRETLHASRREHTITGPQWPDPSTGMINWSIGNDTLTITGSYSGALITDDVLMNEGLLIGSGYFGMADEPVDILLSRERWSLDENSLRLHGLSGFFLFGSRNSHNMALTGGDYTIPWNYEADIFLIMRSMPSLASLQYIEQSLSGYRVTLEDDERPATGWGNDHDLMLTGYHHQTLWTDALVDDQRMIEYGGQRIVWSIFDDSMKIERWPAWAREPHWECDVSSDRFSGSCRIMPPAGDAFIHQEPLNLQWQTQLASDHATAIYGK